MKSRNNDKRSAVKVDDPAEKIVQETAVTEQRIERLEDSIEKLLLDIVGEYSIKRERTGTAVAVLTETLLNEVLFFKSEFSEPIERQIKRLESDFSSGKGRQNLSVIIGMCADQHPVLQEIENKMLRAKYA